MLTRAGPEIGVASTKAFTTQLAALGMLVSRWPGTTARMRSASAAWCTRLIELPGADRENPGARSGDPQAGRSASPTSTMRCSSAGARCTRSRWKARSS